MECLTGSDLFSYLEKREFVLSEKRAKEISLQLASALYYLHSFGIAHRDLKPENIIMEDNSETACCKIVDFGLGKIVGPDEKATDPFGTLSYVAPEVLLQKPYGKEVDIWSLGVITYLLCGRSLPFDDDQEKEIARQTIQDEPAFDYQPWTDEISKQAEEICRAMLNKNRLKRPSLATLINMPWYDNVREKGISRDDKLDANKNVTSDNFKKYTRAGESSPRMEQEIGMVQNMIDAS